MPVAYIFYFVAGIVFSLGSLALAVSGGGLLFWLGFGMFFSLAMGCIREGRAKAAAKKSEVAATV